MKFCKQLEEVVSQFSRDDFKSASIPYKSWKKQLKRSTPPNQDCVVRLIDRHYKTVDQVSKKHMVHYDVRPTFTTCLCKKNRTMDEFDQPHHLEELLTFLEINLQALYKLCKKLEKNGYSGLMHHYQTLKSKQTLSISKLKLQINPLYVSECPICFNDLEPSDTRMILKCGHIYCFDCIRKMLQLDEINATLVNKLAIASHGWRCPICRTPDPVPSKTESAFFPAVPRLP